MPGFKERSTWNVIVTASGASPETTDNIIPTTQGVLKGISVHHDGTNDPTVEIFDGTVAAGTSIYKHIFDILDETTVRFPNVMVEKLSVKTTIGAGTMSVTVFYGP